MPHILWVGPVGAGKTYCAVRSALDDVGDFIVTNQPIDQDRVDALLPPSEDGMRQKTVVEWDRFDSDVVKEARCGVWLIDEAPLWLDARKWDSLNAWARRKIIEHRKDDLVIHSTAQDVSLIDKVFRVLADEVRLVRRVSIPFVGHIWPTSIRPTIWCEHCKRVRRDGDGDDRTWWKRLLGFGTYYVWDVYSPRILGEQQDAAGKGLPEQKALGHGRMLFDIRKAEAYDTGHKLSDVAAVAVSAPFARGRRQHTPQEAVKSEEN